MSHRDVDAEQEMKDLMTASGRPPVREDPFVVDGTRLSPERVVELLTPFLTEARLARIREVVSQRTRTVVPVVEGVVNTGNVSAVMRSVEALGYQDLHVVKGQGDAQYKHSQRTAQGAMKWLDVWRWETASDCASFVRERGMQVVVTHLSEDAVPIAEVDFTTPTALVFGNELGGVSEAMLDVADRQVVIPIHGFTESFNVSVAAALGLYHAQQDRLRRQGRHADLSEAAQERLVARFCLRSVNNVDALLRRLLADEG